MNEKIKKLEETLQKARDLAAKAETEERDFTSDERQTVANLLAEAKRLKAEVKEAAGDAAMRDEIKAFSAEFEAVKTEGPAAVKAAARGTLGERFVNSPEFKAWMTQIAPSGHIPNTTRGLISPPVEFKSLFHKDLITGADHDTSAGVFVQTDYTGIYEPMGRYPLTVLDLISRRTTGSDNVHFVRQTRRLQEAATVPEANVTTYTGATGQVSGEKPEGAMTWEPVSETVKTIAVWIPATKRALSDAGQLRGLIDQELRADLSEELEDQLVNGDGVGENFTGIFNTAGILAQAWNTDIFTTSRQAITTLEVTGRARPTAWVLHPSDWETVELTQDGNNRYYYAGPLAVGPRTLWSVPVVTSQALTQGTALLGDFRKAVLWDRESATIQVSDSHEDFFIRNMVAILAELRAAFGLIRPSAFVEVDLEAGS